MSTGEYLWEIPNGDTPEQIKNHPALRGVNVPNTGQQGHAVMMTTKTLLITAPGGTIPVLHAVDKKTGQRVWAPSSCRRQASTG